MKGELAVGAEDRNRGREAVERILVGVGDLAQLCLGRGDIGDIDRNAGHRARLERCFHQVERAAASADESKAPAFGDVCLAARRNGEVALGLLDQRLAQAQGLDVVDAGNREVGAIGPGELHLPVAQPDGKGQGIEEVLERRGLLPGRDSLLVQPHRRHSAHGPAARNKALGVTVMDRKRESLAAVAELVERLGQRRRVGAFQAGFEHRFAAAIGERSGAVATPDEKCVTAGGDEGVSFAHRGAGARDRRPHGAPEPQSNPVLHDRPEASGDCKTDRTGDNHDLQDRIRDHGTAAPSAAAGHGKWAGQTMAPRILHPVEPPILSRSRDTSHSHRAIFGPFSRANHRGIKTITRRAESA